MADSKGPTVGADKIDYERFVVRKALAEYWRAEEKVEIVMMGITGKIPTTMLCKLNNVSPSHSTTSGGRRSLLKARKA